MATFKRLIKSLTNSGASTPSKAAITKDNLFETIPAGCDLECHSCTIKYPASFSIDEDDALWQTGKGWATHIVIATGKSDWVRDVDDEKGSIMEALSKAKKPTNGRLMVSASNMCPPEEYYTENPQPTTCILLPSFTQIERLTPNDVPELVEKFINPGPTTSTPLGMPDRIKEEQIELVEGVTKELKEEGLIQTESRKDIKDSGTQSEVPGTTSSETKSVSVPTDIKPGSSVGASDSPPTLPPPPPTEDIANLSLADTPTFTATELAGSSYLKSYECPHDYLILLCSHKHRDARCGQSAPLLLKELRRQLQPLGLYRDLDDHRPSGVGIYFINHVGGHKYSANMIIYRKKAGQGIWLARVKPNDIEAIVKWTLLEGKVEADKIRAGFDRSRGVTSW